MFAGRAPSFLSKTMSSPLTICNGALQKIGVPRIMSLSEQTKEAKICNSEYDKARRAVLRLYTWGFASKRVVLAPDPVPPAFEYEYAFQLPSDYLRVIELYEYHGEYLVENGQILANADVINLKYVYDIEDITTADSLFCDALEWFLGYNISRYLVETDTVRAEALQGFRNALPMAKFVQSTEHSQRTIDSHDLVESRFGTGFVRDPRTS